MLTHNQLWTAIDTLALRYNLSASGLARRAGLDPTTFNKSKRQTTDGRTRWPSTESIAKVLEATGATLEEFFSLLVENAEGLQPMRPVPLIGFSDASRSDFFDEAGFPKGGEWDEVLFPHLADENVYGLEISGDSMHPLYRDGDVVLVSPAASMRRGDRVIVKTRKGELLARLFHRRSAKTVELQDFAQAKEPESLDANDILWMARIIWASQ